MKIINIIHPNFSIDIFKFGLAKTGYFFSNLPNDYSLHIIIMNILCCPNFSGNNSKRHK